MNHLQLNLLLRQRRDVTSEYQQFYRRIGLTSDDFWSALLPLIRDLERDPDRLADAFREYVVRSWEREVPDLTKPLFNDLKFSITTLEMLDVVSRQALACMLFGVAAEDLGAERVLQLAKNIVAAVTRRHISIKGAINGQE